jgi:AraC-like DNA-binding protein
MEYKKYFPDTEELKSLVECFYCWNGYTEKELDVQSPPNGFSALVVIFSDPYKTWFHKEDIHTVPKAFTCGLFTSNYHLLLKGNIDVTGVVLKPQALFNIFGIRMSTLVNNRIPLHLLPDALAASLPDMLEGKKTDAERVAVLRHFVSERLTVAKSRESIIDDTIRWIDLNHGNVTVDEVADKFRLSRRYLETRFLEKVGVSPKFYARIRRFSYLSNIIVRADNLSWQDVVFEGGFHDQSHLIKEFVKFNNMSPAEYLNQHRELIRFVKR